ncbi:hypothetical protein [Streptomyces panacea]|uniref:hypothetical protein n=1 Tax=Streptomyces panacea TaxID=3035064 RepID=UPI00339BAE56
MERVTWCLADVQVVGERAGATSRLYWLKPSWTYCCPASTHVDPLLYVPMHSQGAAASAEAPTLPVRLSGSEGE